MSIYKNTLYEAEEKNTEDTLDNPLTSKNKDIDKKEETTSTEDGLNDIIKQIELYIQQEKTLVNTYNQKYVPNNNQESKLVLDMSKVADTDKSKIAEIGNTFQSIENNREDERFQLLTKIHNIQKNIIALKNKAAKLGNKQIGVSKTTPIAIGESVKINGKSEELSNLLFDAYNNVDISYSFNQKECKRLARKIIEFLNVTPDAKFDAVKDCIYQYFKNGVANYTDKEFDTLMNSVKDQLSMTDNDFKKLLEENNI